MNRRISEETQRRKGGRKKVLSVKLLTEEQQFFIKWLQSTGVNASDFTRELWKLTPEFKDFKKIEDKSWLRDE